MRVFTQVTRGGAWRCQGSAVLGSSRFVSTKLFVAGVLVGGLLATVPASDASSPNVSSAASGHDKTRHSASKRHARPSIAAPGSATPGRSFVFTVRNLHRGALVYPFLMLDGKTQCCGSGLHKYYKVPRSGAVRVRIKWPHKFTACRSAGDGSCKPKAWRKSDRAVIGLRRARAGRIDGTRDRATQASRHVRVRVAGRGHGSRHVASLRKVSRPIAIPRAALPVPARDSTGPAPATIPPLSTCRSPWMTNAGSAGTGSTFNVSFTPTEYTRLLGRSIPFGTKLIWSDLRACAPFPSDLADIQLDSLYQQLDCHVQFGYPGFGGDTFDLEAFRPTNTNPITWVRKRCNWDPDSSAISPYVGHIIRSNDDQSGQKAAWVLTGGPGNWHRKWIPTGGVYNCLKGQGVPGPDDIDGLMIQEYIPEFSPPQNATCTPTPPTPQAVRAFDNYGTANAGHAMCRGNPNDGTSMPGGSVSQTFSVPSSVRTLSSALVQIDPDSRVTAHLSLYVNGTLRATAAAAAAGDTSFSWSPVTVSGGQSVTVSITFTATFGSIITVYTAGAPGGSISISNSCSRGAPNYSSTSTGLRAVVYGTT